MLRVKHLYPNLPAIFRLAEAEEITYKIAWHDKVFLMTLTPTDELAPKKKRREEKNIALRKGKVALPIEMCPACGGVLIKDICLNKACTINQNEKPLP